MIRINSFKKILAFFKTFLSRNGYDIALENILKYTIMKYIAYKCIRVNPVKRNSRTYTIGENHNDSNLYQKVILKKEFYT